MTKKLILSSLLALALSASVLGQGTTPAPTVETPVTVTIKANGTDLRTVLTDLFGQAKKNFVVQPFTHFALHLSLENVDFDEALMIIARTANLKIDVQNGIYYISRGRTPAPAETAANANRTTPTPPARPKGILPQTVLARRVTTRLPKVDLRALMVELGKQAKVTIEVDASVPQYRLDAFLINTSLRWSLDEITKAAGLEWRLTDQLTIQIFRPQPETSRISLVKE